MRRRPSQGKFPGAPAIYRIPVTSAYSERLGRGALGMEMSMWLGVLGPLDVRHEDARIAVPAAKQRIVLGTLLVHANQVVSFDQLADAVWDDVPPHGARVTLRNYVKRLRQILGPAVGGRIHTRDPGYQMDVGESELDLLRFTNLFGSGGAAVRGESWEQADA